MIKVDYSKILGHCLLKNKRNLKIDVTIYGGNCLAILTTSIREVNGEINQKMVNFYISEEHIKKIQKHYELTENYYNISLNFAHDEAKLLAEHMVKEQNITIYYCK